MRTLVMSLPLLASILYCQTLQPNGETAFVASPGQIIELNIQARTANNGFAANLEVTFAAPQNASAGEFLDGSGATTTIRTVRTTIDGNARIRYRILAPNLFATLEATSLGISAPVRFALSPPIQSLNLPQTPAAISAFLKTAFATTPKTQIIGPFLLPPNTLIRPAVIPAGPYTRYPRVTSSAEWFYWIDPTPGAPFSHPVFFGRLPLNATSAANAENSLEHYAPYIQPNTPNFISLSGIPGATYTRPSNTGPNTATSQHSLTPTDSCAILLRGDQDSQSDLAFQRLRDELVRQEKVNPENIFTTRDANGSIIPATENNLNDFIARARAAACRKLYLFVDANANNDAPGLLLRGDPESSAGLPATYSYESLVRQLTTLGGIEVQGIFAVSGGTNVSNHFKGWGIRGELVTTSSGQNYGARSAFLKEISTSYTTFNGDLKSVQSALFRSLDPETSSAQPTVADIPASADRFLQIPNFYVDTPGTQNISIRRPLGAGNRIPFGLRLTAANSTDISIPAGKDYILTPLTTTAAGTTAITATARNDGFSYNGRGSVQTGRFKLSPNPCLAIAGGQCNITIERFASLFAQELTLSLADSSLATLPQTKLRFEPNETTKTFVVAASKTGSTRLTISPTLYFESELVIPVIIEDPPSNSGPAPITCAFQASPTSLAASASGGLLSFEIRAANTCVWSSSTSADWITLPPPNSGAGASRIFVQVAPNLGNSSRSATVIVTGQTITITQSGLADTAPAITAVSNGASFNSIASPGSWVTITGSNLATTTRIWSAADFPGGTSLPTSLNSTTVTFGGISAFVYFISPTQINVLAPDGLTGSRVEVQVRRGDLESNRFSTDLQPHAPALFLFDADNRAYPAAVHADGVLAARQGLYPGLTTRAVKSGDIVLLYLTGLGETTPATPANRIVSTPAPTLQKPVVEIGTANADVLFSGKVSSGLYQINVRIPRLPTGDHPIRVWLNGQPTSQTVFLTID